MKEGKSLMPLTESCRISVGSLPGEGQGLIMEVMQRKGGDDDVTTVLLSPDKAHELIEVLLQYTDGHNV